ncbi:MAG: hypothetical protein IK093_08870 [Ruminiclostridium sp.]|nr:hypothetical protein [Ruminiclostridium sp.]
MKLKKILTFAVTTAASAICGAALLSIGADAISVPSGYSYYDGAGYQNVTTLDQYLSHYGELYDTNGSFVGPSTSSIKLLANDGNASLTATQLSILAGEACSNVTIEVSSDGGSKYEIILKDKTVNFFAGGNFTNGANFLLYPETSSYGTLKLTTGNSGYLTGHPFIIHIPGDLNGTGMFRKLLNQSYVDMSDRLRIYTYDTSSGTQKEKNLKVIYSKDADYDLSLTFGNGINAYYYTKYDKIVLHLYNQSNIEAYVEQKVAALAGMTIEQATYDSSMRAYMDSVKKFVMGKFFTWDYDKNTWKTDETVYLTAADLDPLINSYFGDKDVNGNITSDAKTHLDELVRTLIVSSENEKVIENSLYSVFGWDINNRVVSELKSEIVDTIASKLVNAGATIDNYKTLAQYFLNEWATEEYQSLKKEFEDVRTILDSNGTKYTSTVGVIQDLCSLRDSLGTNPSTKRSYTLYETAQLVKNNSGLIMNRLELNGSAGSYNVTDIANVITTSQTTYTASTPNYSYNTETYVTGQSYATKSELTSYINSLNATINDLQNQINSLKNSQYSSNNSTSAYDWLKTTPYGDVDSFIEAVSERVAKKMGTPESAYDIAVRNGFKGSEQAWLNSLVGESAYEIALDNGFKGSEKAWLNSLKASNDSSSGDEKVVYVYGQKLNSASPAYSETELTLNEADAITISEPVGSTYTVADISEKSSKNPATGVAAGIIIPAAAVASLLLIKKDKRRRGRK